MPTNWTNFVKSFAKENNISYGCALSMPDCSALYRDKYGNPKKVSQKKERERMGAEDINRIITPPKQTPQRKQQNSAIKQKLNKKTLQKQLVETIGMMAEDVNVNPVQDIAGNFVPIAKKTRGGRKKGSKNKSKVVTENIAMVIEEIKRKKSRGRPKKYATQEEARKAKIANTIAGAKKRKEKKTQGTGIIDNIKEGVKELIKITNPVEYSLISGASNIVQNPSAVIYGRNDYPPKVRKILSKYGNKNITGITLARTPLPKSLMIALELASGNTFQQKLDNTPYDKLFHLFMCIQFADGSKIMMEKNEVINAVLGCKLSKETETREITSSDIPTALTLNDALEKQRERMGDKYFSYAARENNCQDFILAFLRANKLGNETDASWVKQSIHILFQGNETLRKIANTLTGIAGSFDVIKEGAGFFDDVVGGLNKLNPVMWGIKNHPDVGIKLGEVTNNNLLPAVVEVGKPVYDATAIAFATTVTGNPALGKIAADEFWNKFGKPYDPRSRQDNNALKKISEEIGKKAGQEAKSKIGSGIKKKSNNKIKGMANKWITYVKDYAKKHNMKYTDALKDPKCKAGYKSGSGVLEKVEDVIPEGFIKNPEYVDKIPGVMYPAVYKGEKYIKKPKGLFGKGVPTSHQDYIAELYNQANLGANGRVRLN